MSVNVPETVRGSSDLTPSRLRSKHLLTIEDLSTDEIFLILDTAEAMKEVERVALKRFQRFAVKRL